MIIIDERLKAREDAGNPIRVGMIGAGFMGRGLLNQMAHSVPGERHLRCLGEGVLPQVSFPGFLVKAQHIIMPAQGMQDRPIGAILDGVIGTVVAAPAFDA